MNKFPVAFAIYTLLFIFESPLAGANVLSNPGFESDGLGQNQNLYGWTAYGVNDYSETGGTARSGSNYFKVFQSFSGVTNYNGIYQDYISGPGASYTADGWARTSSSDALAGQNLVWIEVSFRDANANILAAYNSIKISTNLLQSGSFPKDTWVHLQVTNSSSNLVAPAGTYFVRYQVVFQGDAAGSGGSVYFDDLALNPTGQSAYGNWNIIWSDEFNGAGINTNVWTYDLGNGEPGNPGWGNGELEYYTSRTNNAFVAGGLLHIVARQETTNTAYGTFYFTSGRLKTQGLASWKYGRFEWRVRLPGGTGFWPAFWLLGTNITSVTWPGCGEIDVTENNGSALENVQGSLHSGSDETGFYNFLNGDSVANFHTYTLDWATNAILYYVDGHLYQTQTGWGSSTTNAYPFPFNQPFFLIMNIAVGGNYLGNPSTNTINTSSFPGTMNVDYVRIYNQTSPLAISLTRTNRGVIATWPSNVISHLQAQYNAPAGLGTNWTNLSVTSSPALLNFTNGSAYYRLESP